MGIEVLTLRCHIRKGEVCNHRCACHGRRPPIIFKRVNRYLFGHHQNLGKGFVHEASMTGGEESPKNPFVSRRKQLVEDARRIREGHDLREEDAFMEAIRAKKRYLRELEEARKVLNYDIESALAELPPLQVETAGSFVITSKAFARFFDESEPLVRPAHELDVVGTRSHRSHGSVSVAFSPDGTSLAAGTGHEMHKIQQWNVNTGEFLGPLNGHMGDPNSVTYSPDGSSLASGSKDKKIKLWNVNTGECLRTLNGHTGWVVSVSFSPDGTLLASGSGDNCIKQWDINTGECLQTLEGHTGKANSVAFSPDGTLLASGSGDQTIKLWNVETGECLRTLKGHMKYVKSVAFSLDGTLLASGSGDNTIKLWNFNTGECLRTLEGHTEGVESVAFSPDGTTLASGSEDNTIKLWNVKTGECLRTMEGHMVGVRDVAFSPDGASIASVSDDHAVKLWNVNSAECLQTFEESNWWVNSVAFSPDIEKSRDIKHAFSKVKDMLMEAEFLLSTEDGIEFTVSWDGLEEC